METVADPEAGDRKYSAETERMPRESSRIPPAAGA